MNKRKDIIPNNLREYRLKTGLTQKQVAELLGLQCEDRLSHWEKGISVPTITNLIKLLKIYKIAFESVYPFA